MIKFIDEIGHELAAAFLREPKNCTHLYEDGYGFNRCFYRCIHCHKILSPLMYEIHLKSIRND